MRKFGFTEDKAKFIETSHKAMYKDYYDYVNAELDKAESLGYVRLAFGLRLRTPLIKAGLKGGVPKYQIEQERRSAGNALFQSYSMLTMRAFSSFMRRVWSHKEYFSEVRPVVTIYDSIYLDVPNDLLCVKWVNDNLIECMQDISGCTELSHPIVKLSSELEVYTPSWNNAIVLPNCLSHKQIYSKLNKD
jgi:DNA polymerase-1